MATVPSGAIIPELTTWAKVKAECSKAIGKPMFTASLIIILSANHEALLSLSESLSSLK